MAPPARSCTVCHALWVAPRRTYITQYQRRQHHKVLARARKNMYQWCLPAAFCVIFIGNKIIQKPSQTPGKSRGGGGCIYISQLPITTAGCPCHLLDNATHAAVNLSITRGSCTAMQASSKIRDTACEHMHGTIQTTPPSRPRGW